MDTSTPKPFVAAVGDHPGAWYREASYMLGSAAGEAFLLVGFLLALARAAHGSLVTVVVIVPSILSALGAGVLLIRGECICGDGYLVSLNRGLE